MILPARWLAGVALAALVFGVPFTSRGTVPVCQAQNLGQRVVNGTVVDADAAAVAGATVFLRDTKTKAIRSYTSTKDGRFRFAQVNKSDDYDLWAEKDGRKSGIKTVSSWDTRDNFECELKMK